MDDVAGVFDVALVADGPPELGLDRLAEADDGVERGAQFVAQAGEAVMPGAVELADMLPRHSQIAGERIVLQAQLDASCQRARNHPPPDRHGPEIRQAGHAEGLNGGLIRHQHPADRGDDHDDQIGDEAAPPDCEGEDGPRAQRGNTRAVQRHRIDRQGFGIEQEGRRGPGDGGGHQSGLVDQRPTAVIGRRDPPAAGQKPDIDPATGDRDLHRQPGHGEFQPDRANTDKGEDDGRKRAGQDRGRRPEHIANPFRIQRVARHAESRTGPPSPLKGGSGHD